MKLMRQQVKENNVYRWAGTMLVDAARRRTRERIVALTEAGENAHPTGAGARTVWSASPGKKQAGG